MTTKTLRAVALVIALVAAFLVAAPLSGRSQLSPPQTQPFRFAVIGDLGYTAQEEPAVEHVMADLNRETALTFVVHVGDLSSPRGSCTNEVLARRLAQFRASAHPLVFTPGDNDWTDCHDPAVKGGDPLERLANLRTLFFAGDETLGGRRLRLTRQSEGPDSAFARYRENVRWNLGGVTFLTLHVTGSNNGLGRTPEGDAEYTERNKANIAWLQQGFAHATASGSRAVMVLQQASLFPEFPPFPGTPKTPSGITDIRTQLEKETLAFRKPVVLVHGDSHYFRIDKPLSPLRVRGKPVVTGFENFTRVETFGSPYHHWVDVTVEPNDANVFTFRPRLVAANLAARP